LVKFDDRRASTRLAYTSDKQDDARKFSENSAGAPTHFAEDKGSIGTETNHELKRLKIDGAKICHSGHGKLLCCCIGRLGGARPKIVATRLPVQQLAPSGDVAAVTSRERKSP
jgi:hypothetical protein